MNAYVSFAHVHPTPIVIKGAVKDAIYAAYLAAEAEGRDFTVWQALEAVDAGIRAANEAHEAEKAQVAV